MADRTPLSPAEAKRTLTSVEYVLWLEEELAALQSRLDRARFLASHLFNMVPREVWREQGGDDGQGHYEGDYWAAGLEEEIRGWGALAVSDGDSDEPDRVCECGHAARSKSRTTATSIARAGSFSTGRKPNERA